MDKDKVIKKALSPAEELRQLLDAKEKRERGTAALREYAKVFNQRNRGNDGSG